MAARAVLAFFLSALLSLPGCLLAVSAWAVDVIVEGTHLSMKAPARADKRRFFFRTRDEAIAAPFVDPSTGSSLVVFASSDDGQCRAEIPLDPTKWRAFGGDGASRGYRYTANKTDVGGVRRISLRPGRLSITASGENWPCDLSASSQTLPLRIELRVGGSGGDRYCASFGGQVLKNQTGRFRAESAPAPSECLDADLTVANLNLLHGLFCDPEQCRLADRVDLFFGWVVGSACPDLVTLQEIISNPGTISVIPLIEAQMETACAFPYQSLFFSQNSVDDQLILTRYPVLESEVFVLHLNFRNVTFARIDHPIGPVDVFTTHLASGSDLGPAPCGVDCPQECVSAGASTNRECQAVQTAHFIELRHDPDSFAVVTGDFNDPPGTFTYNQFVNRGWPDVYAAAGNPECDPVTGTGCTSGRDSDEVLEIESSAANVSSRIDYVFLIEPISASLCAASIDPASDNDGDGSATRIFADDPNPFAPSCGASPLPVCWPSDHEGVELDLNCR
jgi:endonuclease/exonuclease/phosphatase family metal-dependent hydrolase